MNEVRLTCDEIEALLEELIASETDITLDERRQKLSFTDDNGNEATLTLPLIFSTIMQGDVADILGQLRRATRTYMIILIQAGAAALGYIENGQIARHKVIKKYMVRKKQGKAQLKYLKSKGKSRAGSRIRLKNSISFFEDINNTLTTWNVAPKCETVLIALPVNLKSLFYTANVPPPFDKRDTRLKKVPLDIRNPSFKELKHVNWVVSRGVLQTTPKSSV